jgi:hypothetical protein
VKGFNIGVLVLSSGANLPVFQGKLSDSRMTSFAKFTTIIRLEDLARPQSLKNLSDALTAFFIRKIFSQNNSDFLSKDINRGVGKEFS